MSAYDRLAGLDLTVGGYSLERRQLDVSSGFTRVTHTVVLEGPDERGQGEDITYETDDQDTMPADLPLDGTWTIDSFSRHLDAFTYFPSEPVQHASHDYRRWAFESAALDLALRQAGRSLGEVLEREYRPVRFVVSTRHDIEEWLSIYPDLEFKLDPTSEWSGERIREIAATGQVRTLDFKGHYEGTSVETEPDAELYCRIAQAFPDAVLEDAACTPETVAALEDHTDRLSFDAPIHSLADIDALPIEPRFMNIKPSRFGTVARLFEALDACLDRGITMYGGGQFELGPGRGQVQSIAGLFYPEAPNDVAPGEYNAPEPCPGLPESPLPPPEHPGGFGY